MNKGLAEKESVRAEARAVSRAMRRLRLGLMVFLFSLVVFALYVLLRPPPPPVVLLPMEFKSKMSFSARFNKLTGGWFYRAKVFVVGLPESILLEEKLVAFNKTTETLTALNLPKAVFSNQNVSVWVVPRRQMINVNGTIVEDKRYSVLSAPKVTTGYNSEAAISVESTTTVNRRRLDYGFSSRLIPDASKWNTALTLRTLVTEPNTNGNVPVDSEDPNFPLIKTNFAFAGRIQVPLKHDVIVLQSGGTNAGKCYLLLTAVHR